MPDVSICNNHEKAREAYSLALRGSSLAGKSAGRIAE